MKINMIDRYENGDIVVKKRFDVCQPNRPRNDCMINLFYFPDGNVWAAEFYVYDDTQYDFGGYSNPRPTRQYTAGGFTYPQQALNALNDVGADIGEFVQPIMDKSGLIYLVASAK